jgi:uncharacterized protein
MPIYMISRQGTMFGHSLTSFRVLAAVVFCLIAGACEGKQNMPGPTYPVIVHTQNGAQAFSVEYADTMDALERGLMYRKELPENGGMLFVFPESAERTFWMRNTYVSLDMLFIRADGSIAHLHRMARPFDLSPISSGEPVKAVLEISGGQADKRGIQIGDRVETQLLKPTENDHDSSQNLQAR